MNYMLNKIGWLLLISLAACHTLNDRRQDYARVDVGMSKPQVMDTLGPPSWSDRRKGEDRWIYFLDPHDRTTERIVYFRDGIVTRKGPRDAPKLTAEEMEEIKAERPLEMDHQPSLSDEELKKVIKKEIEEKEGRQKPSQFEKL